MGRIALLVSTLVACGSKSPPTTPIPDVKNEHRSDDELQGACDRKQAAECLELGARFAEGEGVDVDHPRAAKLFERACELGNQDGCAWFGMEVAQGVAPGDLARAYSILETACAKQVQKGCRGVGYMKVEGKGTPKDPTGAVTILAKACDAKDGTSCGLLAVVYVNGQSDQAKGLEAAKRGCELDSSFACFVQAALATDTAETYRLLDKACDLGDAEGCTTYGASLLAGHDVTQDVPRAIKILDRGCSLGSPQSCRALGGALLSTLPGVVADDAKAAKVLERSCDGGDLSGCALLGVAYAGGRGVTKDTAQALALLRRACEQGKTEATATGCYYLGIVYYKGEGTPRDFAQSAKYFEVACDLSWGEACAALADQYADGLGVTADKAKAAQLSHRACEMNHAPSCMKDRKAP